MANLSDYNYDLPAELIAKYPPEKRGTTRLLALNRLSGEVEHKYYYDLPELLDPGDLVILNDTKVIKARILAQDKQGRSVELLICESHGESDYAQKKSATAIVRGKVQTGDLLDVSGIEIAVSENNNGICRISAQTTIMEIIRAYGEVPIPPYLHRQAEKSDTERYQTVFAKSEGSVAAPTASLNFTDELKSKLLAKGIRVSYLTLHVGLGTFLPIRTENLAQHTMHREYYEIPAETVIQIQTTKANGRAVVAIGTTVTRSLEHAATNILQPGKIYTEAVRSEADIFIYPGKEYKFQVVDKLVTNFHAPKSTVLMLAAAFAGWDNLSTAYKAAIEAKYNFLSYGDSMFIY